MIFDRIYAFSSTFLSICLLMYLSIFPSRADEISDIKQNILYITDAVIKDVVKTQFIPNLLANKPDYVDEFNKISIKIVDNPRPSARSYIKDGERIIEINTGIAYLVQVYHQYSVIRRFYKNIHSKDCNNYIEHLSNTYKYLLSQPSFDYTYAGLFASNFCGVPNITEADDYMQNYMDSIDSDRVYTAVIGFMLGHEYGHHLLGHLPPKIISPSSSRKIELEADNFASNLLGRYVVRLDAGVIFSFLEKQRRGDPFAVERRYLAEECRYVYLISEDQRIFGAFNGSDIIEYLNSRVEIKERIPNILSVMDSRSENGLSFSKCDEQDADKSASNDIKLNDKVISLTDCWKQNAALRDRAKFATEALLSNANNDDPSKKKEIGCKYFKELMTVSVEMQSKDKQCVTPEIQESNSVSYAEIRKIYQSILENCP